MSTRLLILVALLAPAACSKPDNDKSTVAARCMAYQSDYWRKATAQIEAGKPPTAPDFQRYGCAKLYRHPVCGTLHPGPNSLATLATACASAYCAELPAPKPGLCGKADAATLDNSNLVRAMVQLDRAVLLYETGVADVARTLSARYRIYLEHPAGTAPAP